MECLYDLGESGFFNDLKNGEVLEFRFQVGEDGKKVAMGGVVRAARLGAAHVIMDQLTHADLDGFMKVMFVGRLVRFLAAALSLSGFSLEFKGAYDSEGTKNEYVTNVCKARLAGHEYEDPRFGQVQCLHYIVRKR